MSASTPAKHGPGAGPCRRAGVACRPGTQCEGASPAAQVWPVVENECATCRRPTPELVWLLLRTQRNTGRNLVVTGSFHVEPGAAGGRTDPREAVAAGRRTLLRGTRAVGGRAVPRATSATQDGPSSDGGLVDTNAGWCARGVGAGGPRLTPGCARPTFCGHEDLRSAGGNARSLVCVASAAPLVPTAAITGRRGGRWVVSRAQVISRSWRGPAPGSPERVGAGFGRIEAAGSG